jgi:hypothetical protein
MRTLYYVPIIHTLEDYASLQGQISQSLEKNYGKQGLANIKKELHGFWEAVREKVFEAIPDPRGLIIYQDGLPVGPGDKIRKLFRFYITETPDSKNFALVQELVEKGAILEGTEDMHLVKAQVDLYKESYQASPLADRITHERDTFIADRINETLPQNSRAILFIGRQHKVIEELDKLEESDKLLYPLRVVYL